MNELVDVREIRTGRIYLCELCGHWYKNLKTAELCEAACSSNQICSPEIIRRAVYRPHVLVMPVA